MTFINLDLLESPEDYAGRRAFNTVFGESVVGWRDDDVSVSFQYSNSSMDVAAATSGSGSTSNADQTAICSITGAVGSARLTSVDSIRYRPGHEITCQFTALFNGAQTGVTHNIGPFDSTDGAGFGTQDGAFGIWFLKGGVKTFVPQASFSHDRLDGSGTSLFNIDVTKFNIFQVQYGWLGISPIVYSVYTGQLTGWRVAHVVDRTNVFTSPHLNNPSVPISAEVERLADSGSSADIRTASWRAGQTGGGLEPNNASRWFSYTVLGTSVTAAARNNIFTLHSKATYQGVINHVTAEVAIVAFDNSLNKSMAVYGTKAGTLSGHSAFADINTANSVMEVSTGGTISGGTSGPATVLRKDSDIRTDVRGTAILIYPGDFFTFEIVPEAAATGTVSVSVRWIERF